MAEQPTFAQLVAKKPGNIQLGQAQYAVCAACHGANGEGNRDLRGPKLAGQEAWYLRRQLENFKSGARGAHEEDTYGQQMAAISAVLVDAAAIDNVIAYIQTLPDNPPAKTISGDIEAGEKIYTTCGACHGVNGEGIFATNAPRQAGMSDWYLADQLKKFRAGIRGAHAGDEYGHQMVMMSKILQSDDRINDVVAYMNTLSGRNPRLEVATVANTETH